jgi:hypothetical protein
VRFAPFLSWGNHPDRDWFHSLAELLSEDLAQECLAISDGVDFERGEMPSAIDGNVKRFWLPLACTLTP